MGGGSEGPLSGAFFLDAGGIRTLRPFLSFAHMYTSLPPTKALPRPSAYVGFWRRMGSWVFFIWFLPSSFQPTSPGWGRRGGGTKKPQNRLTPGRPGGGGWIGSPIGGFRPHRHGGDRRPAGAVRTVQPDPPVHHPVQHRHAGARAPASASTPNCGEAVAKMATWTPPLPRLSHPTAKNTQPFYGAVGIHNS